MAVLLVTQFTVSNGGEEVNAADAAGVPQAVRQRAGAAPYQRPARGRGPRGLHVVAKRPIPSPTGPGRSKPGLNAMPDLGSIEPRNAQVEGPGAQEQAAARAALPAWARSVEGLKASLPDGGVERA